MDLLRSGNTSECSCQDMIMKVMIFIKRLEITAMYKSLPPGRKSEDKAKGESVLTNGKIAIYRKRIEDQSQQVIKRGIKV